MNWQEILDFLALHAKRLGKKIVMQLIQLYLVLCDPGTPWQVKTGIAGAFAYVISPIDAVADVIPVFGLKDDLGVIAATVTLASTYITDDVRKRAEDIYREWFG